MGPGLRLELKQSQQLVMTPQLQQAIRLLQLSNLELSGFLAEERDRNPLVEIVDGPEPPAGDREAPDVATEGDVGDRREESEAGSDAGDGPVGAGRDMAFDGVAAENLFGSSGEGAGPRARLGIAERAGSGGSAGGLAGASPIEDRLVARASLREHLRHQIGQARADLTTRRIAGLLADSLDEHGMLRLDTAAVAGRLGVPPERLDAALALLQSCEPTGVGARSLGECLALQLAERNRLDPAIRVLVDNLDLVARGEHRRLRRLAGVDEEDYAAMLAEIRALDPRPCAGFGEDPAQAVVPDVFVTRAPWGGWQVELNTETLPRVLVDNRYATELERGGEEVRRFVTQCRAEAGWLVKSLDQRARTILKVSTEIVRRQERFLEIGLPGLAPMNLKMVAEAIGMHESTASRVTANKYMATERGVFELKFFFSNAVGGESGEGVSAPAVRHRIRAMVDAEPPEAVLSDDTIVDLLRAEGIDIARRTVAKYRKVLNIPSSVDRRRQKSTASH